jgi:hypothetical protein
LCGHAPDPFQGQLGLQVVIKLVVVGEELLQKFFFGSKTDTEKARRISRLCFSRHV